MAVTLNGNTHAKCSKLAEGIHTFEKQKTEEILFIAKKYAFCVLLIIFTKPYHLKAHLIKKQTIEEYARDNAQCRIPFRLWLITVNGTDWNCPEDILATFRTADLLGNGSDRVMFDIGGNNYRMICHYVFGETQVHLFICWIGTHAEYSKLCKEKNQYSISIY